MKRPYFLSLFFIQFISFVTLYSHGFGAQTPLYLCCHNQQAIRQVYHAHKRNWKKPSVLSKCSCQKVHSQNVVGHIKGTTNCYLKIRFGTCLNNDVICTTPLQEFFVPAQQRWVPAYQLRVGDQLLNKHYQLIPITHMQFVAQPLTIYAIEVEETHNYYVGRHAILTHNIPIPWAFSITLGTSFGGGTSAGGLLGLIGGSSLTLGAGFLVGGVVGLSIYALSKRGLPKLKFEFDIPKLNVKKWLEDLNPFSYEEHFSDYRYEESRTLYEAYVTYRSNNPYGGGNSGGSNGGGSGGGDPRDPRNNKGSQTNNKPPRNSNNKNNQSERKLDQRALTNKEALKMAEKRGFKKTNYYSNGQVVFQKGNKFITIDVDAHNGGVWKMANSVKDLGSKATRLGTYDVNLNRVGN